jgi:SAM-dependent methyltransferase
LTQGLNLQRQSVIRLHRELNLGAPSTECRICGSKTQEVLDLGSMPPANALLTSATDGSPEYPLVLEACVCGNFQLRDCLDATDLYRKYLYITPSSKSLTGHYGQLLGKLREMNVLSASSRVLEIGSNVGAFLEFLGPHVAQTLGVDPARNIAEIANARGIRTIAEFFDADVANSISEADGRYDIVFARHTMAHNRDPYPMLLGVERVLTDDGIFVLENAYAVNTILDGEFDQIYHEHMFFFTLHAIVNMLQRVGLRVIDVLLSDVHGGSIACFARRRGRADHGEINRLLESERRAITPEAIRAFIQRTRATRGELRRAIFGLLNRGKTVYAYGATAKGATLMNYCGLSNSQIPYCADSTPTKQGRFYPKSGIEIVSEEWAFANPPSAFLLTAWNYRDEIIAKARKAGIDAAFVVPIPSVEVVR